MPAYTLGELMSHATFNAGRRADLEQSKVSFIVNEAMMEVAQVADRALSERTAILSLSSGDYLASLPADCDKVLSLSAISGGSSTTLTLVKPEDLDSTGTAGAWPPTKFAYFGSQLEVRPVPNSAATLQMRYMQQISDLTDLAAVPSMATPWRAAILMKAEEKIHHILGNEQAAVMCNQRYLSYVSQLESDRARRQHTSSFQGVRVHW